MILYIILWFLIGALSFIAYIKSENEVLYLHELIPALLMCCVGPIITIILIIRFIISWYYKHKDTRIL